MATLDAIPQLPLTAVGGLAVAALDRADTARLMIELCQRPRGVAPPVLMSSANGEVLSRCASDPEVKLMMSQMDVISADGQPLVLASRVFCRTKLPERVATTDLFHDVARLAMSRGISFYILGASAEENTKAIKRIRALYPALKVVGGCHGYLTDAEWDRKVGEVNDLAPDIVWVCLGVPREQRFCL